MEARKPLEIATGVGFEPFLRNQDFRSDGGEESLVRVKGLNASRK
jgi:hypothetical protein